MRHEAFIQFSIFGGDRQKSVDLAHEIANEIITRSEVDDVSVKVESVEDESN